MTGALSREQEKAMFAGKADKEPKVTQATAEKLLHSNIPSTSGKYEKFRLDKHWKNAVNSAKEEEAIKKGKEELLKKEQHKIKEKQAQERDAISKEMSLLNKLQEGKITRQQYDEEVGKLRKGSVIAHFKATREVIPEKDREAVKKTKADMDEIKKQSEDLIEKFKKYGEKIKAEIDAGKITPEEGAKKINKMYESTNAEGALLKKQFDEKKKELEELEAEGSGGGKNAEQMQRDFEKIRNPISIMPSGTGKRRINPDTDDYDSHLTVKEQVGLGVEKPVKYVKTKSGELYEVVVPESELPLGTVIPEQKPGMAAKKSEKKTDSNDKGVDDLSGDARISYALVGT